MLNLGFPLFKNRFLWYNIYINIYALRRHDILCAFAKRGLKLINIGDNKLVFKHDIVGIFDCSQCFLRNVKKEYLGKPPYKACVVLNDRVYYTTLSVRTLSARLNKQQLRK